MGVSVSRFFVQVAGENECGTRYVFVRPDIRSGTDACGNIYQLMVTFSPMRIPSISLMFIPIIPISTKPPVPCTAISVAWGSP